MITSKTVYAKCVRIKFLFLITLLELTNFLRVTSLEISSIGIERASIKSTYVKSADAGDSFSIQSANIKDIFFGGAHLESTYTKSTNTFEQAGMGLQSF